MKDKILQNLKTNYSSLGFSTEVLQGVATQLSSFVTKEEDIANAVAGAQTMLKAFQSFADNRVSTFKTESDKIKSEAEALKKKLAELEKKPDKKTEENTAEIPSYVKGLQESLTQMQKAIQGIQSEKTSQRLKERFVSKMQEMKIPESYYAPTLSNRTLEDSNKVEALAELVVKNHEQYQQSLADLGFEQTSPPENGSGTTEKDGEELGAQIREETAKMVENSKSKD